MSDQKEEAAPENEEVKQTNITIGDNASGVAAGSNINQTITHNYFAPLSTQNKPLTKEDLSTEEKELLKVGYDNEICTVSHLGSHLPMIWVGRHTFPEDIKYKRALKSLRDNQLIRRIVERSIETYELTGKGDAIAKTLT